MSDLNPKYLETLDTIKYHIQNSELLSNFLDTEEIEDYKKLVAAYEGHLHNLYLEVAQNNPLKLLDLERLIMDHEFEGLYMPKILGYNVLRGRVNNQFKYYRPQERLAKIVEFLSQSANFEYICQRIGQTIQVGFALSSDIWISNLVARLKSKRANQFFKDQKLAKYRDVKNRQRAYLTYKKQFTNLNFATTLFPTNEKEFFLEVPSLKDFLIFRIKHNLDNTSVISPLMQVLSNTSFSNLEGYDGILLLSIAYIDVGEKHFETLRNILNQRRKKNSDFSERFFNSLTDMIAEDLELTETSHANLMAATDISIHDDFIYFLNVLKELYSKGYLHEDTLDATRRFYAQHEGLSLPNRILRKIFIQKFKRAIEALKPENYHDYFEWNKIFISYIALSDNQKFNQEIKNISLVYVKSLIKTYTDKRAKNYQEIKKFVQSTFLDLGFMNQKQLTELFKTKRKKKETQ